MYRLIYEGAETHGGLRINDFDKGFLLLATSGLSPEKQMDFQLQIGGHLKR